MYTDYLERIKNDPNKNELLNELLKEVQTKRDNIINEYDNIINEIKSYYLCEHNRWSFIEQRNKCTEISYKIGQIILKCPICGEIFLAK